MKGFIKFLLVTFIVLVTAASFAVAGGAFYIGQKFEAAGARTDDVVITIPSGSSIRSISGILIDGGVLPDNMVDAFVFQIGGRFTGQASRLKAGEYEVPAKASIEDILNLLESGQVILRQVTVREGLTNWEIKQLLLAHDGLAKGDDFEMQPEGEYLPETYSYQKGDTAEDIMRQMNEAMEKTVLMACGILLERMANASFHDMVNAKCSKAPAPLKTIGDVLTLASIVEKETAVADERRRVAGVFINRLRKGMLLQTDPTVIYAITKGAHQNEGQGPIGRQLLKKDLEIDSPYNTYKYAGLPPTPIANPGKASIEAVLNPEEHNYIYFVADGSGGHAFGRNLAEHNANVAKWRKIKKNK